MKDTLKSIFIDNLQIIVIVVLAFFLLKSCNNQPKAQSKSYKSEKDSLKKINEDLEFQYEGLIQENSQIIDSLNKLIKRSKITEGKLYQLQQKTSVKPSFVPEIIDCNDTIQSMYYIGAKKDSLCNSVILQKNDIITSKDKIIVTDSLQRNLLSKIIDNKDLTIETQDIAIQSEIKKTRYEARKKTFWQILVGVLTVLKFIK
jgi:hypothetical protein